MDLCTESSVTIYSLPNPKYFLSLLFFSLFIVAAITTYYQMHRNYRHTYLHSHVELNEQHYLHFVTNKSILNEEKEMRVLYTISSEHANTSLKLNVLQQLKLYFVLIRKSFQFV